MLPRFGGFLETPRAASRKGKDRFYLWVYLNIKKKKFNNRYHNVVNVPPPRAIKKKKSSSSIYPPMMRRSVHSETEFPLHSFPTVPFCNIWFWRTSTPRRIGSRTRIRKVKGDWDAKHYRLTQPPFHSISYF